MIRYFEKIQDSVFGHNFVKKWSQLKAAQNPQIVAQIQNNCAIEIQILWKCVSFSIPLLTFIIINSKANQ